MHVIEVICDVTFQHVVPVADLYYVECQLYLVCLNL